MGAKARSLVGHLESLPDPRSIRGQRHVLLDILLIAVLAVLCGADSWEDIHRFAKSQEDWLKTFLSLPNGVPSAAYYPQLTPGGLMNASIPPTVGFSPWGEVRWIPPSG